MAPQLDYGQVINQGVNQYFQGRRLGNEERRQMLEEQRMAEAQKRAEEAAEYERSTRPLREQALQSQVESQGIDTQRAKRKKEVAEKSNTLVAIRAEFAAALAKSVVFSHASKCTASCCWG